MEPVVRGRQHRQLARRAWRMAFFSGGEAQALDQGPPQGAPTLLAELCAPPDSLAHGQGKRGKAEQTQGAATGAFPLVCPFPKLQSFPF